MIVTNVLIPAHPKVQFSSSNLTRYDLNIGLKFMGVYWKKIYKGLKRKLGREFKSIKGSFDSTQFFFN